MTLTSGSIAQRWTAYQTAEPGTAGPPYEWINPSGGQSGNNSERYIYSEKNGAWELDKSTGPDTPTREVAGSLWRDTSAAQQKVYDGGWQDVGVTDHSQLNGLTASNHHVQAAVSADFGNTTLYTVSEVDRYTTMIDITGSGVMLGGFMDVSSGTTADYLEIVVDGTKDTSSLPTRNINSGGTHSTISIPPVSFDSDLFVEIQPENSPATANAWVIQ